MTEIHLDLAETTVDGGGTRQWSLTRDACPELAVHRIKHLGLTDAAVPYRRVRLGIGRPMALRQATAERGGS
jgi:hypothetical protein